MINKNDSRGAPTPTISRHYNIGEIQCPAKLITSIESRMSSRTNIIMGGERVMAIHAMILEYAIFQAQKIRSLSRIKNKPLTI